MTKMTNGMTCPYAKITFGKRLRGLKRIRHFLTLLPRTWRCSRYVEVPRTEPDKAHCYPVLFNPAKLIALNAKNIKLIAATQIPAVIRKQFERNIRLKLYEELVRASSN